MRHRLVGAIVLGCLAIIFIPVLLDGEGVSPPQLNTSIPQQPAPPSVEINQPQRPDIPQSIETDPVGEEAADETVALENLALDDEADSRGRLEQSGLPESWVVRVGTYSERDNAINMQGKLTDAGYKAYTRSRGNLNVVYVGPVLSRAEVAALQEQLESEIEGLDGTLLEKFVIQQ